MATVKITINNQPRLLLSWNELTEAEQEVLNCEHSDEYSEYSIDNFIRYRGDLLRLDDFFVLPDGRETKHFEGWDAYSPHTAFSGVLLRYDPDDSDRVVMGSYYE